MRMEEDAQIRDAILTLAASRGTGKTICPSEVARHVAGADPQDWRRLMPAVRAEAVRLAEIGRIDITKGGRAVDPQTFAGIYRIGIRDE